MGVPDSMKGHLPFAFVAPAGAPSDDPLPAHPSPELFKEINNMVREQIGSIASLGGMIQGRGMIPKSTVLSIQSWACSRNNMQPLDLQVFWLCSACRPRHVIGTECSCVDYHLVKGGSSQAMAPYNPWD